MGTAPPDGGAGLCIMFEVSQKEFETFVSEGVVAIPERFRHLIDNVAFLVDEAPTLEQLRENGIPEGDTLLGLYEGIPHTARGVEYGNLALPDRIWIFKRPIEAKALEDQDSPETSRDVFREEVRRIVSDTVWHEVAHHFGLDEEAVERREWERGVG